MRATFLIAAVLLLAACRNAGVRGDATMPLKPVATVRQIMEAIVIPDSQAVFDAVAYTNGELVKAPASDDDWHRLETRALAVAEAGNLLMMAPRARDNGTWMAMSRDMNEKAAAVAAAAAARNEEEVLDAGGGLYGSCTACHMKYVPD